MVQNIDSIITFLHIRLHNEQMAFLSQYNPGSCNFNWTCMQMAIYHVVHEHEIIVMKAIGKENYGVA